MPARNSVAGDRIRARRWLTFATIAAVASAFAGGASFGDEPRLLELGKPIEQNLESGERHAFRVALETRDRVRLMVEQRGIDVEIELKSDSGDGIVVDAPFDRRGRETVLLPAEGPVRFEIAGREPGAPPGRYTARLEPIVGSATEVDERLRALKAENRAGRHYRLGTADGWRDAIADYRQAAVVWRTLGDDNELAHALYAIAVLHRLVDDPGSALGAVREVFGALRRLPDVASASLEGYASNELGLDQWRLGDLVAARDAFARAVTLGHDGQDRFLVAAATSNLCLMDLSAGALVAGQACYRDALPLIEAARAPEIEGAARVNLGRLAEHLGEPDEALDHYDRARASQRAQGDRRGEAKTLNNLGVLLRGLGELDDAMARYAEALAIFDELDDERWQARAMNNIGNAYRLMGDPRRAIRSFEDALTRFRTVSDPRGMAATLDNLGMGHREQGNLAMARSLHEQALTLRRSGEHRRGEAVTLRRLGTVLAELGESEAAIEGFEAAIAIAVELGDRPSECESRRGLGAVHLDVGQLDDARRELARALRLAQDARLRTLEAEVHVLLARAGRDAGERTTGRRHVAAALGLLDDVRRRIGSTDLRTSYSGLMRRVYELDIELLLAEHHDDPSGNHHHRALEVSERARARTLLEHLQEAGIDLEASVDPALVQRRDSLQRRLLAKAERLADSTLDDVTRATLESSELPLLQRLEVVEAEMRRRTPSFAALVRRPALTARDIQALVDPSTTLAVYVLAEPQSHLFRVTHETIDVFALPDRATIEAAARRFHARSSVLDVATRDRDHEEASTLAAMLHLPALLSTPRVAIVADGALHVVPFAALPVGNPSDTNAPAQRLVDRADVVSIPSAAVLAHDRGRGDASPPLGPPSAVAILADPVFGLDHAPLPGTRQEAKAIAALTNASLTAFGFEAHRGLIEDGRLRAFDVVHFATHGIVDIEHPARSGLVLSQLAPSGEPRAGFLALHDIYRLPLDASLVVLSGCGTAFGPVVRGEGLVGLARAFLHAGARRVVASLWKVDDRATAALMTHFYRGMWQEGLSPAKALADAQRALAASRRHRDPYHWAGFILVGDWRERERQEGAILNPVTSPTQ